MAAQGYQDLRKLTLAQVIKRVQSNGGATFVQNGDWSRARERDIAEVAATTILRLQSELDILRAQLGIEVSSCCSSANDSSN